MKLKLTFLVIFMFAVINVITVAQSWQPYCTDYNGKTFWISNPGDAGMTVSDPASTGHSGGNHTESIGRTGYTVTSSCSYYQTTQKGSDGNYMCQTHANTLAELGSLTDVGTVTTGMMHGLSYGYHDRNQSGLDGYTTCLTVAGAINSIPTSQNFNDNGPNGTTITIYQNDSTGSASFVAKNPSYPVIWQQRIDTPIISCPFEESNSPNSPLVIVDEGVPFNSVFSSVQDGVAFGIVSDIEPWPIAWTKKHVKAGFLVLPDAGGHVQSLKYGMFGNLTKQLAKPGEKLGGKYPVPYKDDGFEALGWYDLPHNGGNGNGFFDPGDAAWKSVKVWCNLSHDANYDAINKPEEVMTLDQLGITAIDVVNYDVVDEVDGHGNSKRFSGTLTTNNGKQFQIYDVFLNTRQ